MDDKFTYNVFVTLAKYVDLIQLYIYQLFVIILYLEGIADLHAN